MTDIYDDPDFFDAYSHMARSEQGLKAAGEWHELQQVLPDFIGKTVLDLGCGYGWHCRYAAEHGAKQVLGIDLSHRMIEKAQAMTKADNVTYKVLSMTDIDTLHQQFDVIISSLAIHYIADYAGLVQKIDACLAPEGHFVMSVEHPIFTAQGQEQWVRNAAGEILYWPVDRYFDESLRETNFLNHQVAKYHRTVTTYVNTLLQQGLRLTAVVEPTPTKAMQQASQEMRDELRRPMMLIVAAVKP
ncbi:MAG: class I SAM-dependent methyltransferase [Lactobacillus sp.]|nr:class I SAM-dependent methyltransferase [Lactobacillus sp.]